MPSPRLALVAALTAALPVLAAAPAAAGGPAATTYHGVFTGVHYTDCAGGAPVEPAVTGVWNISALDASRATVTVDIVLDGRHHVSFGTRADQVTSGSSTVTVRIPTQAGPLTVDLTGSALTYSIAPYDLGGLTCAQVTYTGTLGR